jgi:LysR family glycine cleavage system transcriptional activator
MMPIVQTNGVTSELPDVNFRCRFLFLQSSAFGLDKEYLCVILHPHISGFRRMAIQRIPTLNALRAFESSARHMSFTVAADELCVTQAAVSYQIRQLEEELCVKLFERLHRKLILTKAGMDYLPAIQQALEIISKSTAQLRGDELDGALRISASQSLSSRWLAGRIQRISSKFPAYDISVDATDTLADFKRDNIDLAIRYAPKIDPELDSELLCTDRVFPVCSPGLLEGSRSRQNTQDILQYTLLSDNMTDISWQDWLHAAEVEYEEPLKCIKFSHTGLAIDAAIEGQGIALGRSLLVADGLSSGRLVRPYDLALTSRFSYFIVNAKETAENPKIKTIKKWFLTENEDYE